MRRRWGVDVSRIHFIILWYVESTGMNRWGKSALVREAAGDLRTSRQGGGMSDNDDDARMLHEKYKKSVRLEYLLSYQRAHFPWEGMQGTWTARSPLLQVLFSSYSISLHPLFLPTHWLGKVRHWEQHWDNTKYFNSKTVKSGLKRDIQWKEEGHAFSSNSIICFRATLLFFFSSLYILHVLQGPNRLVGGVAASKSRCPPRST